MGVAYCIKCKQKQTLKDTEIRYTRTGACMEHGKCSICGTRTARFLNKAEKQALRDAQTQPKEGDTQSSEEQTQTQA